jgi:carbamoyl-phosphate synthase large subunit
MKLLITSVGSLLGQNILDSIESRRYAIDVIGIDASADNPRNYRCDTVYLVSKTDSETFSEEFARIIEKENPDFILPGRDGDNIFLSDLKSKYPEGFKNKIPFGTSFIPHVMIDKYQTHLFCKDKQLPFADSLLYRKENGSLGLESFIDKHKFPLLVKPRNGFGSHGVFFVFSLEQMLELAKDGEILIQEYLGQPEDISIYKDLFKKGIPLFFQVPETEQYAAQTIISPDGTVGDIFFTKNTMVHGRAEYTKQIHNDKVDQLVNQFSRAFYENGWYGPVNFQLKPDRKGNWKVFELNSRLTGTSSGRVILGYDEFGILANLFVPELKIPDLTKTEKVKGQVYKYLQDNLLLDKDVNQLNKHKVWKRS